MKKIIVLRYGELFLKGGNRHLFEKILLRNIKRSLADLGSSEIERGQGRIFVRCEEAFYERTLRRLSKVFGLSSLSPALACEKTLADIAQVAIEFAKPLAERSPIPTFKIESRRADKRFPMTSPEISREVGGQIHLATKLPVDIHNPDVTIGVEVGDRQTFVFGERVKGAGGLPVGASAQLLLLLSGGIDSPVAGHLMQKRGCRLRALYFHSPPYTNEHAWDKVKQLSEVLARSQSQLVLDTVHFTEIQKEIRDKAPPEMAVVLYRRMMVRIACRIAQQNRCSALATGESLGQVASQTVENIATIEAVSDLPIFRPLTAFDKMETINIAHEIESYEISILPHEDCCSLFVPKHPITRASLKQAQHGESRLDVDAMVEEAVANMKSETIDAAYE
jgi:tRNA uracil 4-sulfurtransferase